MRSDQTVRQAIEEYADMVQRICFLHLKNREDTEDIFQTVFLKYTLYPGVFQDKAHEKAWLIRVTVNACKDLLKSFYRKQTVPLDLLSDSAAASNDANREVLFAVLSLPKKYKDVIYLYYYEGYTAIEIADILNKSQNGIYTLLARGRTLLKQQLGGDGFESDPKSI